MRRNNVDDAKIFIESVSKITDSKLKQFKADVTKRALVEVINGDGTVDLKLDGETYTNVDVRSGLSPQVNEVVWIRIPNKSFKDMFVDVCAVTGGSSGTSDYTELTNKPSLNTNNITTQTPTSEIINGTINLHKIAKTGSYNDLLNQPSIPTNTSDLTNDSNFVVDVNYVHTDNNYTTTEKSKLSGIESGAEVNNISDINATDLTDGGSSTLHYHTSDRDRSNHTGTQLASTISDFFTNVRATVLTGISTTTNAVISSTDTVLTALGKLQKQISDNLSTLTSHIGNTLNPHSVTKSQVGLGNVVDVDTTTTANITDSLNKRFVTDAQELEITHTNRTALDNVSGVNTGDQDLSGLVPKTTTVNSKPLSSNITLNKTDVGLGNVDNTSDLDKPISSATQTALDNKITTGTLATVATTGNYSDLAGRPLDDDFHNLTAITDSEDLDELLIYDSLTASYKKITKTNLISSVTPESYVVLYRKEEFTSTVGQTIFTLTSGPYVVNTNRMNVYVYGSKQPSSAFTETSSTSITLTSPIGEDGAKVLLEWTQFISVMDYIHASTHAVGGVDPLTPTMIGLGNVNNTVDPAKNVLSATKLTTARTISLTGDVSGSAGFDGSANASVTVTVADDSHNHIISNVDNLQTILDSKQATITGGATTITSSNLTINRALLSDGSGKVGVSVVTSTQLGYLSGVTSAIQTQLNTKAPLVSPTLTGTPNAPTATNGTNSTQIATTAFVSSAMSSAGLGDMLKSVYDTNDDGIVNSAAKVETANWTMEQNTDGSLGFFYA